MKSRTLLWKFPAPVLILFSVLLADDVRAQQVNVTQVHDDAKVIRRVAEVAGRDLPRDILRKIISEDIDILRGKRADATYEFARYGREEAGRIEEDYTVASGEKLTPMKIRGDFVYQLLIESPSRRYLVRKNQRVFVDRVEIDLTPIGPGQSRFDKIQVATWLDRGDERRIDLPDVAKSARITVYAHTEKEAGPASMKLSLIKAKIIDDPASPYSRAVENAKLLLQNLDKGERSNVTTLANLIATDPALGRPEVFEEAPLRSSVEVAAPRRIHDAEESYDSELFPELQEIEDLLTGTDEERREGLDRLHQVIRRLRPLR